MCLWSCSDMEFGYDSFDCAELIAEQVLVFGYSKLSAADV